MTWVLVAVVGLVVLLAVWQTIQITAVRRAVDAVPNDGNVVATLRSVSDRIARLEDAQTEAFHRIDLVEQRLPFAMSRVGVVAYDAFGNISGNLSRSIAMISEQGDGIVLSILAAREEILFFAKEIRAGRGMEQLSPEEQAALDRALGR